MASKSLSTIPAVLQLYTHEVWTCLLGMSYSDLLQLGILRLDFLLNHL